MKIYKIKLNKEQLRILKAGWRQMMHDYDFFWENVQSAEKWMRKETGIKDLEFIKDEMCGGEWIGIGNVARTCRLYQREELE